MHEAKSNYSDAGATASDTLDGNITDSLVTVSTVNINKVGEYSVSYNVVDANGNNAATVKRVVVVKDSTIPIIVLNGENAVTHEAATNYNDLGATASDTLDGNISTSISTVSNVNKGAVGDYSVKYNVTDANGNAAVEVVRVVKVVDTTPPVITVKGDVNVIHPIGSAYDDAGATGADTLDGVIDVVSTGSVDSNRLGQYVISYDASDANGNKAATKTRTVAVVDLTAPELTLLGDGEVEINAGDEYDDVGAIGKDNVDGDISSNITVLSNVDISIPGEYKVTFSLKDAAGNESSVSRQVTVVDKTAPVITLNGDASILWEAGTSFIDPGAIAKDAVEGDLSSVIVVSTDINVLVPGSYTLSYNVKDSSGNEASTLTRVVKVVDSVKPVITPVSYTHLTLPTKA